MCMSMLYYSISAHMHVHVHTDLLHMHACSLSLLLSIHRYVYCIVRHTCMHAHARTHSSLYIILCENRLLKALHWRAVKRTGTRVTHMPAGAMPCHVMPLTKYVAIVMHTHYCQAGWLNGMAGFIRGSSVSISSGST